MQFIKYSITFKILVVGIVLATIFEIGIRNEGMGKSFPAILVGWFRQIVSTIPVPYAWPESLFFSLKNSFFFYGSFFCLFVISRYIRRGQFLRQGRKSVIVISSLILFSIMTIWNYADIFLNQKRYYVDSDIIFSTSESLWAFNAYDNIIAIAILLQIAQASINFGLQRVFKRQVTT